MAKSSFWQELTPELKLQVCSCLDSASLNQLSVDDQSMSPIANFVMRGRHIQEYLGISRWMAPSASYGERVMEFTLLVRMIRLRYNAYLQIGGESSEELDKIIVDSEQAVKNCQSLNGFRNGGILPPSMDVRLMGQLQLLRSLLIKALSIRSFFNNQLRTELFSNGAKALI